MSEGGLSQRVRSFLEADGWPYEPAESGFAFGFAGEHGQWRCYAWVREEQAQVVFYSYPFPGMPAEAVPRMMELITRANCELVIGSFELDLDAATLQFRTSIDVEESEESLTAEVIQHLLYANVLTVDRHLPGLRAVIAGEASPQAALHAVTGD